VPFIRGGCQLSPVKLKFVQKTSQILFFVKIDNDILLNCVIEGEFEMIGSYAASYLPWILIPVVTWLMPIVVMGLLFVYIESDA